MVAEDELTVEEIARALQVSKSTVEKWKAHPEFKQRVEEEVERISEATSKAATKAYKKGVQRRLKWFDDILATIDGFTAEDLARMKNNPISTYNLAIRLHTMISPAQRRAVAPAERIEEDDFDIDPDAARIIADILAKNP